MGLRDLKASNKSMLSKVLWNIHEKDSLWIKWVNHFYFADFWGWEPKRVDSPLLKGLAMIRDEMRNKMKSEHDVVAHLRDWFNGNNNKLNKAYLWFSPNL